MIGKTIKTIALAIAILSYPASLTAQDYIGTPVTVSKEKVRINGKICYSHIVLEKQTLFSIAKAYNVTVDDIYMMNPSLKETGLKKNSIILIPAPEVAKTPEPKKKEEPKPKVEVQEVVPEEKPDSKVVEKSEKKQEKQVKTVKQKVHVRKWYEDLDVIAQKYGVTVEALMKANNLTGRKLANRQKLIIPEPGEIIEEPVTGEKEEMIPPTDTTVTIEPAADSLHKEEEKPWIFSPKDEVAMTMILPLRAAEENISRNNLDFYCGALLAVYDMAEKGISTDLDIYDSADGSHKMTEDDLQRSDVVIGPVSSSDLGRLLEVAPEQTMIVSPLDQRAEPLAFSHRNFIQAPTPHKVQYDDLAKWIREDTEAVDTVIIFTEKGAAKTEAARMMIESADSARITYIPFSYSILEGRDVLNPLKEKMTLTGTNRILIASESEAFVNDVVRNLNILIHEKYNVVLYAPSKIRSFETIEVENFHNTSLHVSLGYYIDYESRQVKDFLLKYRALYNTEPTQFAFQGYDLTALFIESCSRYGGRWPEMLSSDDIYMLQSTFRYRKVEDSGYVNNGVRRIVYGKDWTVTEIK